MIGYGYVLIPSTLQFDLTDGTRRKSGPDDSFYVTAVNY